MKNIIERSTCSQYNHGLGAEGSHLGWSSRVQVQPAANSASSEFGTSEANRFSSVQAIRVKAFISFNLQRNGLRAEDRRSEFSWKRSPNLASKEQGLCSQASYFGTGWRRFRIFPQGSGMVSRHQSGSRASGSHLCGHFAVPVKLFLAS